MGFYASISHSGGDNQRFTKSAKNFNVGLFSAVIGPTFLKLGMQVTTIELYLCIPVLVTFDLYRGHKVTI